MECPTCMIDSTSHSFKKISEKDGMLVYYTNPAKATDYNTDRILAHYEYELQKIGNKKWIWIFDSDGFDIKQALEVKTGIGIARFIKDNVHEIKIINPTWHIKTMLHAVSPFLNKSIKDKITILNRYCSILEFINTFDNH